MRLFKKNSRRMTLGIAVAVLCVAAIGMLMGTRSGSAPEEPVMAADDTVVADAAVAEAPVRKAPARKARRNAAPVSSASTSDVKPVLESKTASPEEKAAAASLDLVTLTGCLERDDDTFRLKDAEGMSAPKARSWKSGFLKKGAAKVEVVDASNRLRLSNHVGHKVTVTGTLYEKEIVATAVRQLSSSCDK
jgi:hypothetical protein